MSRSADRPVWAVHVVIAVAVSVAFAAAMQVYALETWLLHGQGEYFFWVLVVAIWVLRPAEGLLRGGGRGLLHAVCGATAWGVALHWLTGVQLHDRADDRFAVLALTLPAVLVFRVGVAPWLLRRGLRRALGANPRLAGWFGAWQIYVGESLEDPLVPGEAPRTARLGWAARWLGRVDRVLLGRRPLLPAFFRQEVAVALDRLLAALAARELQGQTPIWTATKDGVAEEVALRFQADCEAGLHAGEANAVRMRRLEAVGFAAARFLLDVEDELVVRQFRDAAITTALDAARPSEAGIYSRLQRGPAAVDLLPELVRSKDALLDAPGAWRAIVALDLYRQGFANWATWLMEVGGHSADEASKDARHALAGAVLARRMREEALAGEHDRIHWLARGAMNLARTGDR